MKISLDEHIKQSIIAVNANKLKGNRHGQILSMLYSDPYHFIEEIIQNAEDACRRNKNFEQKGKIKILITDRGIDIYHNGSPFTENDLMSITTFAATTKSGNTSINMIGKFGIGFRAVYGICDEPEIHSMQYHFKIRDYEILEKTTELKHDNYTTLIRLPFKENLDESVIHQIKSKLFNIDHRQILFLTHIFQIEVSSGEQYFTILRHSNELQKNISEETLTITGNNEIQKKYLLFKQKPFTLNEIAIAFGRNDENTDFVKIDDAKAYVYFPTQLGLSDKFIIHGRFTTNPTRESIIFDKEHSPENFILLSELECLLTKSLKWIKKEKMLSAKFFSLFDWGEKPSKTFALSIQNVIYKFIADEKCIQGHDKKLYNCNEICLPEHPLFCELIEKKEILQIFLREEFLSEQLQININFVNYLRKTHKLKLADIDSFAFFIKSHHNFLKGKNIHFFTKFYKILEDNPQLWNKKNENRYFSLRKTPIILNNKKILKTAFFENGQAAIFIGKTNTNTDCVNYKLSENPDCLNFLKMLGIPEINDDIVAVEKIISTIAEKNICQELFKLYNLYENGNDIVKKQIQTRLGEIKCIPAINNLSKEKFSERPSECYIPNTLLRNYFEQKNVTFINDEIFKYFSKKKYSIKAVENFFVNIGCNNFPLKKKVCTIFSTEEKEQMRSDFAMPQIIKEQIDDFTLDGLDDLIEHINFEKSKTIWNLLQNIPENYKNGTYTFESYTRVESVIFQASFIKTLRNKKWLFDKYKNIQACSSITISDINANYEKQNIWLTDELEIKNNSAISEDEAYLLRYIRENNIKLSDLANKKTSDIIFSEYKADETSKKTPTPTLFTETIFDNISDTLIFKNERDDTSIFEKELLDNITKEVFKKLANNDNNIKITDSGIIEKSGKKIFVGRIDYTTSSVILNRKIETEILQNSENTDIYVANENKCTIVRGSDFKKFSEKFKIMSIKKTI